MSPYPTLLTVETHHQRASRIVFIFEFWAPDSNSYIIIGPIIMAKAEEIKGKESFQSSFNLLKE
jgi:hypothetical protein